MDNLLAAAQTQGQGGGLFAFFPMILMFAIIYFLLIRPQMKRQRKQRDLLGSLKKGDQVITRGGIYGKIESFKGKDDQQVLLDVGLGNKLTVARPYIVGLAGETTDVPQDR